MKKNKRKSRIITLIWLIVMFILSMIMVMPFIWTVITSLTPKELLYEDGFFPSSYTIENYITLFSSVPMAKYILNSLFLATAGVVMNLFFGSLAGYAFAKLRFKGKEPIFLTLFASMMIAGVAIMIPQYLILYYWPLAGGNDILGEGGNGLLNSYWAIILPGGAGAYAIFMMRQFFIGLPDELIESSRIDGLSEFGIYRKIFLPLSKPALATLALVTFQSGWNSFMWPLIVLKDQNLYTVQIGLSEFAYSATNKNPDYGALMAGSIVVIIPVLLLFIFGNKYFVEGLAFSGSKE